MNGLKTWLRHRRLATMKKKLKHPEFDFLFEAMPDRFVCFDCETTGLNPQKDRIVSLSALKMDGDRIQTSQSLNLLIQQSESISAESIQVHHIRNMDVANSEHVYQTEIEAMRDFLAFIEGRTLVGYYLAFDVAMVNQIIQPWLGISLPNPQIEVSGLYYEHAMKKYHRSCVEPNIDLGFDAILQNLGIPNLGQHDAYNDALMTALIYLKLCHLNASSA
ncbi:MAG: 3'-5' exonuclease [Hydrogenovibrio sp.]